MQLPTKRTLALGAVPAAGLLTLALAVATRSGTESALPERASRMPVPASSSPAGPLPERAVPPPRPKPAPDSLIAEKTEEARIRTTYQNFRTAVATGNHDLQRALQPILKRDRDVALRLAKEELSRAHEPLDQTIAQQMVEALRN